MTSACTSKGTDELAEFTKNNEKEKNIWMDSLNDHGVPKVREAHTISHVDISNHSLSECQ